MIITTNYDLIFTVYIQFINVIISFIRTINVRFFLSCILKFIIQGYFDEF